MQRENKDDDSRYCVHWPPVVTTASSSGSSDGKRARNADENKEAEGVSGDSGYCDPLTPEVTTESSGSSDTMIVKNAGKNRHLPGTLSLICTNSIAVTKYIIAAVVIIALIIAVIILSVKKPETYPPCPSLVNQGVACPDFWIGYVGKCFYASKEESNWSLSLKTCSSLNASLAVIDTQNELDFLVEIFRPFHYWFDLSREVNQNWKWSNGTEFKNRFSVRGEGFCAYVNGKGVDSTLCSMEKLFLCSRPESCRIIG